VFVRGSRFVVGLRCLPGTEGRWPLVVGPARLIPTGGTADDDGGRLHLAREGPGTEVAGVAVVTLCGRPATSLGVGVDLDVLGADRERLCRSCWRVVEGWLAPPKAADADDEVLVWLVETVLRGGSAMIDDVPFGRDRPLRQQAARQIKAAIGGTVRTALVSPTTILVYSALVIDAKTEDQQHQEMRDAMLRLWDSEEGRPLDHPDRRRR
jgi:hypothetical protein